MRNLSKNVQKIYYCTHQKTEYTSGGTKVIYNDPMSIRASVSASKGVSQSELFGNLQNYDKTIIVCDKDCPIDENTALFIDKVPQFDKSGSPLYDYVVVKVARSLNTTAYAVSKVS